MEIIYAIDDRITFARKLNKNFEEASGGGSGGDVAWADVTGKPTTFAPTTATISVVGGVKMAPFQNNSTATEITELVSEFNALLINLRGAGIIASS